jgi:hypothetical protein
MSLDRNSVVIFLMSLRKKLDKGFRLFLIKRSVRGMMKFLILQRIKGEVPVEAWAKLLPE